MRARFWGWTKVWIESLWFQTASFIYRQLCMSGLLTQTTLLEKKRSLNIVTEPWNYHLLSIFILLLNSHSGLNLPAKVVWRSKKKQEQFVSPRVIAPKTGTESILTHRQNSSENDSYWPGPLPSKMDWFSCNLKLRSCPYISYQSSRCFLAHSENWQAPRVDSQGSFLAILPPCYMHAYMLNSATLSLI